MKREAKVVRGREKGRKKWAGTEDEEKMEKKERGKGGVKES